MPAISRAGLMRLKGRTFSAEKFAEIIDSIFESGYTNTNGALNTLADYLDYKAFLQIEEFESADGHKIILEFIKEFVNGRVSYYVKDVEVYDQ